MRQQRKCEFSHLYKEADTSFLINDLLPDRKTIRISLPEPPEKHHLIDGWGLHPDEQYFRRKPTPDRLKRLERDAIEELKSRQKSNRQQALTGSKIIEALWEMIEEQEDLLQHEIKYIKNMWYWRVYGYWFYNDGKPTYITGRHFMFLNFFYMPEVTANNGYPEYRDRHRREFLFREYLRHATETFRNRDTNGHALPEDDGSYDIIDVGMRLFFGDIHPKNRRNGSTIMALSDMINDSEISFGVYSTMQSKDGEASEKHFKKDLLSAWAARPFWIRPTWIGTNTPSTIRYQADKGTYGNISLNSIIDYTVSAAETKQDGNKVNGVYLVDESGKCFGLNTMIRMYDGSVKAVQDIKNGELVMGNDSTPRLVSGVTKGKGLLYRVDSKFGSFVCNDEHLLSLKASTRLFKRTKPHSTVTIPAMWYGPLSNCSKNNLKLYREGQEYPEKDVLIDPYFLGLWLGDGSSKGVQIHNTDKEVINFLYEYAEGLGLRCILSPPLTYRLSGPTDWAHTELGKMLRQYRLYGNKHIPKEYLINSEQVRLNLLAGLIDTDGSKDTRKNSLDYEITQKSKQLAYDIRDLAMSLGFYATVKETQKSCKRPDGSKFVGTYHRVGIYGDVYKIPVKIGYKRYEEPTTWRNRNPNRSWLTVTPMGEGSYYGFVVDNNHLFQLENGVVVHNTSASRSDVLNRWEVIKYSMSLGDGTDILGYATHISTVEDISSSGEAYLKMIEMSSFYQRGANGHTLSGLACMQFPAFDGLEGFIDIFGMSVMDTPDVRQIRLRPQAQFAKLGKGAKQFQQEKRDALAAQATPAAMQALRQYKKKFPWTAAELHIGTSGDLGFDYDVLDKRLAELRRDMSRNKEPWKTGNFYREGNDPEGKVLFRVDPDGKFQIAMDLAAELTNLKRSITGWDSSTGEYVPMWEPVWKTKFTCGADPIEYFNAKETSASHQSAQSDGGIAILWERDKQKDPDENPYEWDSRKFVLSYRHRPASLKEYNEDVLMACEYFGAMLYLERNKTRTWEYFIERGRGGYLKYDVDMYSGKVQQKPGCYMSPEVKNDLFSELKDYILYRAHKEPFYEFLLECRNIQGKDEMTRNDKLTAHGLALLGSKSTYGRIQDSQETSGLDLMDLGLGARAM